MRNNRWKELPVSNLFFSVLEPSEKETFLGGCEEVGFRAGDVIVKKGEESTDLFVVKSGKAKAVDEWDEDEVPLAVFDEGDVFGEMSFIYEGPRSATVIASEDLSLYKMSKERFVHFMVEEPFVAARFLYGLSKVLIQRLRFADEAFTTVAVMNRELKEKTERLKQSFIGNPG